MSVIKELIERYELPATIDFFDDEVEEKLEELFEELPEATTALGEYPELQSRMLFSADDMPDTVTRILENKDILKEKGLTVKEDATFLEGEYSPMDHFTVIFDNNIPVENFIEVLELMSGELEHNKEDFAGLEDNLEL